MGRHRFPSPVTNTHSPLAIRLEQTSKLVLVLPVVAVVVVVVVVYISSSSSSSSSSFFFFFFFFLLGVTDLSNFVSIVPLPSACIFFSWAETVELFVRLRRFRRQIFRQMSPDSFEWAGMSHLIQSAHSAAAGINRCGSIAARLDAFSRFKPGLSEKLLF